MFKGLATVAGAAMLIVGLAACDPGTDTVTPTPPQATFKSTAKPITCKKGYHRVMVSSDGYSYHYKCVKDSVSKKSSKAKKRARR